MSQKRRAKVGELKVWDIDVLAYSTGWMTRVTVRDRERGIVCEHTSLSRLWALRRAVQKLNERLRDPNTITTTTSGFVKLTADNAPPFTFNTAPSESQ